MRTKLILIIVGLGLLGFGGWKLFSAGSEAAELRAENVMLRAEIAEYVRQIEIYQEREEKIDTLKETWATYQRECKSKIAEAKLAADQWLEKYEEIRKRPPTIERVEVPVEVAAPGTPCEAGLRRLAEWMIKEAQSGRIR